MVRQATSQTMLQLIQSADLLPSSNISNDHVNNEKSKEFASQLKTIYAAKIPSRRPLFVSTGPSSRANTSLSTLTESRDIMPKTSISNISTFKEEDTNHTSNHSMLLLSPSTTISPTTPTTTSANGSPRVSLDSTDKSERRKQKQEINKLKQESRLSEMKKRREEKKRSKSGTNNDESSESFHQIEPEILPKNDHDNVESLIPDEVTQKNVNSISKLSDFEGRKSNLSIDVSKPITLELTSVAGLGIQNHDVRNRVFFFW